MQQKKLTDFRCLLFCLVMAQARASKEMRGFTSLDLERAR